MAVINVPVSYTFDQWRIATNSLGTNLGDLTTLTTTEKSSLVAAINEVEYSVNNIDIGGYLTTWAGSTSVITVGTISTGTWNATAIADGKIASALTGKTYNGISLTSLTYGFRAQGGTNAVGVNFITAFTDTGTYTMAGTNACQYTFPVTSCSIPSTSQQFYIGTTQVAINRTSGALVLDGVTVTGAALVQAVSVISSPTNLSKNTHVVVTAAVTVTLPGSPTVGDTLMISNFSAGNVTVDRNGLNIMATPENMTMDIYGKTATLKYVSVSLGWILI